MITLKIKDKSFECPTTSFEIGYHLGNFLMKLKDKNKHDPSLMKRLLLSQIMETDEATLSEVMEEDIDIIYESIPFLNFTEFGRITSGIIINKEIFTLTRKEDLTCEQYLDCDRFVTEDDGYFENADKVAAVLYRSTKSKEGFSLGNIRNDISKAFDLNKAITTKNIIPLDYDGKIAEGNVNTIAREYSFGFLCSCFKYFLEIKEQFAESFEPLFQKPAVDDDDIEKTVSMAEVWGLKHYIEIITDGNIIEMDYWLKQPVSKLFTELVYRDQAQINKNR